jgi:hypothetical protein
MRSAVSESARLFGYFWDARELVAGIIAGYPVSRND